jgi:TonB family protein
MYENKSFQLAVLISILVHFAVFLSAPHMGVISIKETIPVIKIAYVKPKAKEVVKNTGKIIGQKPQYLPPLAPQALPDVKKDDILNPPGAETPVIPKQAEVEAVGSNAQISSGRAVIQSSSGKKFETIINEEKDSGRKATYIGYYRSVRERIRYYADRNYIREGSTGEGEVFISFTVTSKGELLQVAVIEKRSIEDPLLRNVAINSVRDASPFPAFPQSMNQYQITFNVVISFELNR